MFEDVLNKAIAGADALRFRAMERPLLLVNRQLHARRYATEREPLVSIVIATYNRGRILTERTIPSILAQSHKNFEVVVVGDRCIDDTPQRMAKIADPRVRFFDLPRRGTYPQNPRDRWFVQGAVPRNAGLKLARGSWLAWISDDDLLLPEHFETMLDFAQKGDYEFVSAGYTCEVEGKTVVRHAADYDPPIGGMQTWLYRSYLNFFQWNVRSWRKSWNRPCDYDLQDRMFRAGVRMGCTDSVVAHVPAVEGTRTVGLAAQAALEGA